MNDLNINDDLYFIHYSSEEIFLQNRKALNKILCINILNTLIKEESNLYLKQKVIYSTIKCKAILGIIKIKEFDHLIYVKTAQNVCFIENSEIFKIVDIEIIPINSDLKKDKNNFNINNSNYSKEIDDIIYGIKNLLKLGFYYSYSYDLTSSKQTQNKKRNFNNNSLDNNNNNNITQIFKNMFETTTKKYFFNYNLYKKFLTKNNQPINPTFIIPIICGFVSYFDDNSLQQSTNNNNNISNHNNSIRYILISRRSANHCGTRYNTRGIDDEGHVANYCETEQIIYHQNNVLSFCILRGSAPVFFQQTGIAGIQPKTEITRNENLTKDAFSKHLNEIHVDFPLIFCINLLNTKKNDEDVITKALEKQIKMRENDRTLRYYFFDMQNECPNDNYDKIESLMKNFVSIVNIFKFYCEKNNNNFNNEVLKEQKGVCRVNCLDCLDRTNVLQARIAWLALEKMLNYLNIDTTEIFHSKEVFFSKSNKNNTNNETKTFKEKFRDIWGENGDEISIQYAGTASTITTITKTGRHDLLGMIQHGFATFNRIYKGNFEDWFKQKCFDVFLQKNVNNELFNNDIIAQLNKREKDFVQFENFVLFIGTWNINGANFNNQIEVANWLTAFKNDVNNFDLPDFYVIGFQEIVELNTQNIIYNSNNKKKDQIKSLISESLNSIINNNNDNNDSYVLVKDIDLVGIYLLVFIKSNHMNKITKIDFQIVKNGLMGNIGNKGSCFVRMNVNDTIICIANNHFSAGIQYSETRRSEIVNVLNTTINKYPNVPFKDYDYFFLFGDLNIRLNLELQDENIVNLINKFNNNYFNNNNNFENIINNILKFDQFKIYQNETSIISNVEEGKINFCPTYKYFIGENKYDVRKRVPAWCDRILFKKNSHTKCLCYNRCEFTLSDHKPVYGLYQITTRKIDKEKRNKILEEIREKFNKNFNNNKNFPNVQKNISENIDENFFKINNNNYNINN